MLLGLLIIVGFCLKDIFAFTVFGRKLTKDADPKSSAPRIKLLAANVLMENDDARGLLASIEEKDPDIILMVETDDKWRGFMKEVETRYPHNFLLPLPDHNGMLFYSKYPILDVEDRRLIQDHIPSLKIDLELEEGHNFRLYGVHPRPPRRARRYGRYGSRASDYCKGSPKNEWTNLGHGGFERCRVVSNNKAVFGDQRDAGPTSGSGAV